jgi:predicted metal-dependent peptidase
MFKLTLEEALRASRVAIYTHASTCMLGGVLTLGTSEIVDDGSVPTACTDGRNKLYGRGFCGQLPLEELIGVDIHEAVHIFLNHIPRHRDLMKEDMKLANAAMDYADNDFIRNLDGYGDWFRLPDGHLYDPKFHGWTVRAIYNYLKTGQDPETGDDDTGGQGVQQTPDGVKVGGKEYKTETLDTHNPEPYDAMSDDERQELQKKINQAVQEAAVMAGVNETEVPRAVNELLAANHDWKEELSQFVNEAMRGQDEYTFRRFNSRRIVDDLYRPSKHTERVGKILIANDTSGSISDEEMSFYMGHLSNMLDQINPDSCQVLWWGTKVVGDQTLTGSYGNLREVLKPVGGGGTYVSGVAEYINNRKIDADCMIVFTDGYVEENVVWNTAIPTLWVVTLSESFTPPKGRKVKFTK